MNTKMLFISAVETRAGWNRLKTLETSLRRFGGEVSQSRIMVFVPDDDIVQGTDRGSEGMEIRTMEVSERIKDYRFAARVTALAQAEKIARDEYRTITWIDPVCLILKPPLLYILNDDKDAAVRPVHIQNVGLSVDDPLDEYWRRIYKTCGVNDIDMTVESFVDGQQLRAYFNTHAFSINPAIGLMEQWLETFTKMVLDRKFQLTCCRDDRHRIFLFQAILSTLLVRELKSERIRILPRLYNYPYNLQSAIPAEKRFNSIDNLVSLTYEGRSIDPAEITDISLSQPYLDFLQEFKK